MIYHKVFVSFSVLVVTPGDLRGGDIDVDLWLPLPRRLDCQLSRRSWKRTPHVRKRLGSNSRCGWHTINGKPFTWTQVFPYETNTAYSPQIQSLLISMYSCQRILNRGYVAKIHPKPYRTHTDGCLYSSISKVHPSQKFINFALLPVSSKQKCF